MRFALFTLFYPVFLALFLFSPLSLRAEAGDRAEVLEAIEALAKKVTEFETTFQEMTKAGTLYQLPKPDREFDEVNWECFLRDVRSAVNTTEGVFERAVMHNEKLDSPAMKKLVDEFEPLRTRLKALGYISLSRLDEQEIPEEADLIDAVQKTRRGFCLVHAGTATRNNRQLDASTSLLEHGPETLARLLRAVKVADDGDPKVTPNLEKHPRFQEAKTEIDRMVQEAARLRGNSPAGK